MKAKVVDLVRTGDKWDFVHAEDQEILTQRNEAGLSFPAIGNLLASAAQQDSQLRELLSGNGCLALKMAISTLWPAK
jgi:hypothetical protein